MSDVSKPHSERGNASNSGAGVNKDAWMTQPSSDPAPEPHSVLLGTLYYADGDPNLEAMAEAKRLIEQFDALHAAVGRLFETKTYVMKPGETPLVLEPSALNELRDLWRGSNPASVPQKGEGPVPRPNTDSSGAEVPGSYQESSRS